MNATSRKQPNGGKGLSVFIQGHLPTIAHHPDVSSVVTGAETVIDANAGKLT